jgi:S1-C subfamily serine protease
MRRVLILTLLSLVGPIAVAPAMTVALSANAVALAQSQEKPLSAADIFKRVSAAVVTITTSDGFGSGVSLDEKGIVVTNLHVIRGNERATIRFANGDAYDDVSVLEVDARRDLVLLKIKGFKLPIVQLGDSEQIAVGHLVYAIGAPKGLELTLSNGIVSGLRDTGEGYRAVQTSAALSSGSSGGGLFDSQARLIGITSFKIRDGENLNFAVPINYVRGLLGAAEHSVPQTLAVMNERLDAVDGGSRNASRSASAAVAPTDSRVDPYSATAHKFISPSGMMELVAQQANAMISARFTYANGFEFASAKLWWVEASKSFVGYGTFSPTECSKRYVPYKLEIQIVREVCFASVARSRASRAVTMRSLATSSGKCHNDRLITRREIDHITTSALTSSVTLSGIVPVSDRDEPPFYSPQRSRAAHVSTPGEEIWRTHVVHVWWSCELRFHGESYGWEAQILRDGGLVMGRRFLLRELAVNWAMSERASIERGG